MSYDAFSWPTEEHATGSHSTEREYLRNWRGMPLRTEWNASPSLKHCQTCKSCGYKWDEVDFTYRGAVFVNGNPPPVAIHQTCWNCFQCETNHEQTRKFWESADKPQVGSTSKKAAELKPLGGKS